MRSIAIIIISLFITSGCVCICPPANFAFGILPPGYALLYEPSDEEPQEGEQPTDQVPY